MWAWPAFTLLRLYQEFWGCPSSFLLPLTPLPGDGLCFATLVVWTVVMQDQEGTGQDKGLLTLGRFFCGFRRVTGGAEWYEKGMGEGKEI